MKKLIATLGFVLIILGLTYKYKNEIYIIYDKYMPSFNNKKITIPKNNEYYRDYDFKYVKNTKDFVPKSYQDILNIYYTVLNSGVDKFTFYCPKEYTTCLKDIKALANNQTTLSNINNYVHPFNSFKNFATIYDETGKINLEITKAYSEAHIKVIENEIDQILATEINDSMNNNDKIKTIHNYIINNSKYDSNRSDNGIIEYESDNAYGPLIEGYSLCGGYSDTMELFLEAFDIESFKVSSEKHVWNAVYLNERWLNLDLTWDDPVTNTGEDVLEYNYFLIDTNKLLSLKDNQHNFDKTIYKEL